MTHRAREQMVAAVLAVILTVAMGWLVIRMIDADRAARWWKPEIVQTDYGFARAHVFVRNGTDGPARDVCLRWWIKATHLHPDMAKLAPYGSTISCVYDLRYGEIREVLLPIGCDTDDERRPCDPLGCWQTRPMGNDAQIEKWCENSVEVVNQ